MNDAEYKTIWTTGNNPASFSGGGIFSKTHPDVNRTRLRNEIFPTLITYSKFKVAKPPRVYNPYFVRQKRKVIQSDLIFMKDPPGMNRTNQGYQYILIVQDTFSRKVWGRALKTKRSQEVKKALAEILREMRPFHKDARFVIDRGTEYLNNDILNLLEAEGLKITHPSDGHASHVERANLSLQRLLYQKMEEQGGKRIWLNHLPNSLKIMNERYHRIIRMSPEQAERPNNKLRVNTAMSLYRDKAMKKEIRKGKKIPPRFSVGDQVRIKKEKKIFARGYKPTFTDEIFKVKVVLSHLPITMYTLEDFDGQNEIKGNFYPEELSLVKGDVYKIEKIIRRERRNGIQMALVKWEGFPARYNSWIRAGDLVRGQIRTRRRARR